TARASAAKSGATSTTRCAAWRSSVRTTATPSYDSKTNLTYAISRGGSARYIGTTSVTRRVTTTSEAVARLEHHLVVVAELPQDRGARAAEREVAQAEPQVVAYEVGRAREHEPRLALDRVRAFHLELEALGEQLLAERPGEAGLGVVDQEARRAVEDGDLVELHERREAVDQVVRADPPLDGVEGREEVAERHARPPAAQHLPCDALERRGRRRLADQVARRAEIRAVVEVRRLRAPGEAAERARDVRARRVD